MVDQESRHKFDLSQFATSQRRSFSHRVFSLLNRVFSKNSSVNRLILQIIFSICLWSSVLSFSGLKFWLFLTWNGVVLAWTFQKLWGQILVIRWNNFAFWWLWMIIVLGDKRPIIEQDWGESCSRLIILSGDLQNHLIFGRHEVGLILLDQHFGSLLNFCSGIEELRIFLRRHNWRKLFLENLLLKWRWDFRNFAINIWVLHVNQTLVN